MDALFFLIIGFILLIKGGDWLVDGSVSIAKRAKISSLVIGLTIVSFGTSAPEFFVNIFASFEGASGLAIGNVLGSNTANILLILGASALVYPLRVVRSTVLKEIPFSLFAVVILSFLVSDVWIDSAAHNMLSRIDGAILLIFFALFLYYTYSISRNSSHDEEESEHTELSPKKSMLAVVGGLIGLTLGGRLIVLGGTAFGAMFGLSETFIGLTIVALGTSLPELATSAIAAYKKNTDIAVGNVVGSNIFNTLWILGAGSAIKPLPITENITPDLIVVFVATLLLFIPVYTGTKHRIQRRDGAIFVALYIGYIIYLVVR